jgi:hypothetical protein
MADVVYYNQGDVECIDAIRACMSRVGFQDFCRGTIIKYLWRYRHKGYPLEDLEKARDYLNWLIESVEGNVNHD